MARRSLQAAVWMALAVGVAALVLLRTACDAADERGEPGAAGTASRSGRSSARASGVSAVGATDSGGRDVARTGRAARPATTPTPGVATRIPPGADPVAAAAAGDATEDPDAAVSPTPVAGAAARARAAVSRRASRGPAVQVVRVPSDSRDHELFGADVAIDGDLAVVAAPGAHVDDPGSAYVLQRGRDGTWSVTSTLRNPRPGTLSFASRVACSGRRIAVFGGLPDADGHGFRTYVPDGAGGWVVEAEVSAPLYVGTSAAMSGDRIAFATKRDVVSFERTPGGWVRSPPLEPPALDAYLVRRTWVALHGDVLAWRLPFGDPAAAVRLFDRVADVWRLRAEFPQAASLETCGALGGDGTWLVLLNAGGEVSVTRRTDAGWGPLARLGAVRDAPQGWWWWCRPLAADGDLAVATACESSDVAVFHLSERGWRRATLSLAPWLGTTKERVLETLQHPALAVSGRTVLLGDAWCRVRPRSVAFLEVTDEILAAAGGTEVPDPK